MAASTLSSLRPRLPAGWKRAKSSWVNSRSRLSTNARASPSGDHGRGAGAGRQAERTDLVERAVDHGHVGLAGEGAAGAARQRDQRLGQRPQRPQQPQDFLALAAVGQHEHGVVGVDHAEVAVDGLGGVEEIGAGAGGVEGAGDFQAHVGGLAGAGDGDAAGAFAGDAQKDIDGLKEGVVESAGDEFESRPPRRGAPGGRSRAARPPSLPARAEGLAGSSSPPCASWAAGPASCRSARDYSRKCAEIQPRHSAGFSLASAIGAGGASISDWRSDSHSEPEA